MFTAWQMCTIGAFKYSIFPFSHAGDYSNRFRDYGVCAAHFVCICHIRSRRASTHQTRAMWPQAAAASRPALSPWAATHIWAPSVGKSVNDPGCHLINRNRQQLSHISASPGGRCQAATWKTHVRERRPLHLLRFSVGLYSRGHTPWNNQPPQSAWKQTRIFRRSRVSAPLCHRQHLELYLHFQAAFVSWANINQLENTEMLRQLLSPGCVGGGQGGDDGVTYKSGTTSIQTVLIL